ncbi:NRDE family protein [Aliagarivorans marinus]|uniref:NRDE family protein n=1 Tax=Aliagarivorans marinus TaxID=561965 RepID=UPI0003F8934E|nr:NRDE family protein [Aliagarivorans marinus]
MCTLSLLRNGNDWLITMNRDEARDRHEGQLQIRQHGTLHYCYPLDLRAEGSWFGFNQQGIAAALLNRYQDPQALHKQSRGALVPMLLQHADVDAALQQLRAQQLSQFNPFDLLLFANRQQWHLSWNGQQASWQQLDSPDSWILSSSSFETDATLAFRYQHFEAWLTQTKAEETEALADQILGDFHLNRDDPIRSVMMDREIAHSKSICQLLLSSNRKQLRYFDETSLNLSREGVSPSELPRRLVTFKPNPKEAL